jgi:hypothetical protein
MAQENEKNRTKKTQDKGLAPPPLVVHECSYLSCLFFSLAHTLVYAHALAFDPLGFCLFFSFNMEIGFNQRLLWLFSVHCQPFL